MKSKTAVRIWLAVAAALFYVIYKLSGQDFSKATDLIKNTITK